jgi:imidazolonepropionase-like amidohydrolase
VHRGDIVAPRIVPSRNALGITGGHCDETGYVPGVLEHGIKEGVADGPWEVVQAVRYQIKHGAQVIKTCATAGVLSMEGPVGAQQYTYDELKAMVDEAARHGVKVAAHAHGTEGIKAAVRAGVASIEHGSMLDDEAIALMKQKGTYLVPTTYLADRINLAVLPPHIQQKARQVLPLARASLRKAIAAGVKIAFGTDAAVFPHGENAREFAVLTSLGMAPLEALRTATIHAADLLGTNDRGELAPGLLADIIAVPGNPLTDIRVTERVLFVMQGGKTVRQGGTQISFKW